MQTGHDGRIFVYLALPILVVFILNLAPLPDKYLESLSYIEHSNGARFSQLRAESFLTAASFFPWRGDLWEQAGMEYETAGNTNAAIGAFQKALDLNDISANGKMMLGDALLQNGDYKAAIDIWNQIRNSDTLSVEIYARLLHAFILQKDFSAAVQILGKWNGWEQASSDDIYQVGLYLSVSQPDQASEILTQAAELNPELKPNIRIIQAGINASNPGDPMAYRLLLVGRALGSIDQWDLAEKAFTTASTLEPEYAEAWAFLGEAQDKTGNDGMDALNKAIQLKPDSILIQAMIGLYLQSHGEPDQALIYLQAAAAQEPENGIWQVEIGNTLALTGDLTSALPYYQKSISMDPENASYWRDLAAFSISYNVQVNEIGLPAARKAVALDPVNPIGLDLLGQFLLSTQDLSSAERMFLRAVQNNPNYALAQFHLGMTYLEQGKKDEAYQVFELSAGLAKGQPLEEQIQRVLAQNFP